MPQEGAGWTHNPCPLGGATPSSGGNNHGWRRKGGKKIALRGGGWGTEAHFPYPPPLLGRRDGRGGLRAGVPNLPCRGGGVNPTSMAQSDTHVALIILITQMCGGGGLLMEKTFSGQNLCSCAFGANIRSYTKQRARHGTPFRQPPRLTGVHVSPPPPPTRRAIFRSPRGRVATEPLLSKSPQRFRAVETIRSGLQVGWVARQSLPLHVSPTLHSRKYNEKRPSIAPGGGITLAARGIPHAS